MKAVILCAGYATRLYPLTLNTAKPLLKINGKPLLEYTLESLNKIKDIGEIIIITNNKFYNDFAEFENSKIRIINDLTNIMKKELGALWTFLSH